MPPSTSTASGTTMTPTMTPNVMPPSLPTAPIQLPTQPAVSPVVASRPGQTIIRMAPGATAAGMQVRPGIAAATAGNIVRVRAPVSAAASPGQIKVVGAGGQPQIIKAASAASAASTAAGNMSGIAALAAAAAATSKISTAATPTAQTITTASGQAFKVVQQTGVKVGSSAAGQTAVIGGQTVRLAASPGGAATLLKTGTALAGPGGKQIILQNKGVGGTGQPQVVTLVKTSQGMQVATVPKAIVQTGAKPAGQQIVQAQPGKAIPQVRNDTIVL